MILCVDETMLEIVRESSEQYPRFPYNILAYNRIVEENKEKHNKYIYICVQRRFGELSEKLTTQSSLYMNTTIFDNVFDA